MSHNKRGKNDKLNLKPGHGGELIDVLALLKTSACSFGFWNTTDWMLANQLEQKPPHFPWSWKSKMLVRYLYIRRLYAKRLKMTKEHHFFAQEYLGSCLEAQLLKCKHLNGQWWLNGQGTELDSVPIPLNNHRLFKFLHNANRQIKHQFENGLNGLFLHFYQQIPQGNTEYKKAILCLERRSITTLQWWH